MKIPFYKSNISIDFEEDQTINARYIGVGDGGCGLQPPPPPPTKIFSNRAPTPMARYYCFSQYMSLTMREAFYLENTGNHLHIFLVRVIP